MLANQAVPPLVKKAVTLPSVDQVRKGWLTGQEYQKIVLQRTSEKDVAEGLSRPGLIAYGVVQEQGHFTTQQMACFGWMNHRIPGITAYGVHFPKGMASGFLNHHALFEGDFPEIGERWCLEAVPEITGLEVAAVPLEGTYRNVMGYVVETPKEGGINYSQMLGVLNILYAPFRGPRTAWLYLNLREMLPDMDKWRLFAFLTGMPFCKSYAHPKSAGLLEQVLALPTGDSGHWMNDARGFSDSEFPKTFSEYFEELGAGRHGVNATFKGPFICPDPLWTLEQFAERVKEVLDDNFDV